MRFSILHISDLHRDLKDELTNGPLLESLIRDMERYKDQVPSILPPSLCVVSGDLIYGVSPRHPDPGVELERQYDQAVEFLISLADAFFHGNRERVVLIPGNHDVSYPAVIASATPIDIPANPPDKKALTKDRSQVFCAHNSEQVGTIEAVVPDVVESAVVEGGKESEEYEAGPPILREDISSDMKILTTDENYPQLNGFGTFLGLSDRLMQTESPFFKTPHTTRIIWAGHRVIYIFTNATGELSLYYDIELRDPLGQKSAGGGTFATTTLITKKRIFIPVPSVLADEFRVETGSREFFVRFDLLGNDADFRTA